MSQSEFAILGAGAIGSILSAHLARAGHSVTLLARGRRAQQIQDDGLRVRGLAEICIPVHVLTDASRLRQAQVLIVATKTPGTAAALEQLRHVEVDTVFSIQNGVQKNEQLARNFGADRVLGALANTSGELLPSGEVQFTRNVNLSLGELDGNLSERARRVAQTIDDSGVRASAVADIAAREWSKFAAWLGLMSLSVTTRTVTWRFLSDASCALVLVRLVREVALLAKAQSVDLTDEGALLPLRAIIDGEEADAVESVLRVGAQFRAHAPDHRVSALQDLEAGRPLEVEETFGHAVGAAERLQLSLPLLDAVYRVVAAIDRTRQLATGERHENLADRMA